MNIRDITNAALIELHLQSIDKREASFRPDIPTWARDRRIEEHETIVREMARRGLLRSNVDVVRERSSSVY